ncbi:MAG: OsmC family protein [Anaerolineae bacterium]
MGQIAVKWAGDDSRMFIGRDSRSSTVTVGYWQKPGEEGWTEWRGAKASDLLVIALCACSGYDVVDILQKQKAGLTGLTIIADAEQAPKPPWPFVKIHLHYVVSGHDLDPKKVEQAIKLSEEKYCSVAATIRGVTEITHDFEVLPAA